MTEVPGSTPVILRVQGQSSLRLASNSFGWGYVCDCMCDGWLAWLPTAPSRGKPLPLSRLCIACCHITLSSIHCSKKRLLNFLFTSFTSWPKQNEISRKLTVSFSLHAVNCQRVILAVRRGFRLTVPTNSSQVMSSSYMNAVSKPHVVQLSECNVAPCNWRPLITYRLPVQTKQSVSGQFQWSLTDFINHGSPRCIVWNTVSWRWSQLIRW